MSDKNENSNNDQSNQSNNNQDSNQNNNNQNQQQQGFERPNQNDMRIEQKNDKQEIRKK